MGLGPNQVYSTPLWDLNRMSEAFRDDRMAELEKLRIHAWLVSVYSGLDTKSRRRLTPEKMLPLSNKPEPSEEEVERWTRFFQRRVIKRESY